MEGLSKWRHSVHRCLLSRAEIAKSLGPQLLEAALCQVLHQQRLLYSCKVTTLEVVELEFPNPGSCLEVMVPVASPDGSSSWGPAHNLPLAGTGSREVERLKGKEQFITIQLGASV